MVMDSILAKEVSSCYAKRDEKREKEAEETKTTQGNRIACRVDK